MSRITIHQKKTDRVTWKDANLCDFVLNERIDIWQTDVPSNMGYIDEFLKNFTPAEITRANKYFKESDRNRFIVSRGALRNILSKYNDMQPADIQFDFEENKKPRVSNIALQSIHFNLSDSADKILIAIATSPLGIDVELINPKFKYQDIINHNFNNDEADYIELDDSLKRFFLLWTRKEAILKATGIGLTEHLKLIPSLDGEYNIGGDLLSTITNWQLNSFNPQENYIASIATGIRENNFHFWKFDLKKIELFK